MNLLNECTKNEIDLINQAGIKIENKDYSSEELKRIEYNITDYIMNHSSKNGDITRLQIDFDRVFRLMQKQCYENVT